MLNLGSTLLSPLRSATFAARPRVSGRGPGLQGILAVATIIGSACRDSDENGEPARSGEYRVGPVGLGMTRGTGCDKCTGHLRVGLLLPF